MPHTRFCDKFYWLIHKSDHTSEETVTIGMTDTLNPTHMWLFGMEEMQTLTWVATHFHIIELKVPNEILKFKASIR